MLSFFLTNSYTKGNIIYSIPIYIVGKADNIGPGSAVKGMKRKNSGSEKRLGRTNLIEQTW